MKTTINIAHASDVHYCEKHLEWVDKAFGAFVDGAIADEADCALISGDSFDHQLHVHDPAVHAFLRQISRLANAMPVLVLQGTFSHDRPGSLDVLRTLGSTYPVHVADRIHQVALIPAPGGDGVPVWMASEGFRFEADALKNRIDMRPSVIVCCLPSIHKGTVKAMMGDDGATAPQLVDMVCQSWADVNLQARAAGVPTVLTTHGTVNGVVTESKYAMISPDHEFSTGVLFGAEASAVMIGHIHAHNTWEHQGRRIAYPGSITTLVFGHAEPTYWLSWRVGAAASDFECIQTPRRSMVEIEFNGPPNMEQLKEVAPQHAGAHVRIRWSVDEEFRHAVDQTAIRELFAAAADVKLEGRVNPVQRSRAEGLTRTESLVDKLKVWGRVTDTDTTELQTRLGDLQILDVEHLVHQYGETDHTNCTAAQGNCATRG